jgi:hypothetical protein
MRLCSCPATFLPRLFLCLLVWLLFVLCGMRSFSIHAFLPVYVFVSSALSFFAFKGFGKFRFDDRLCVHLFSLCGAGHLSVGHSVGASLSSPSSLGGGWSCIVSPLHFSVCYCLCSCCLTCHVALYLSMILSHTHRHVSYMHTTTPPTHTHTPTHIRPPTHTHTHTHNHTHAHAHTHTQIHQLSL